MNNTFHNVIFNCIYFANHDQMYKSPINSHTLAVSARERGDKKD